MTSLKLFRLKTLSRARLLLCEGLPTLLRAMKIFFMSRAFVTLPCRRRSREEVKQVTNSIYGNTSNQSDRISNRFCFHGHLSFPSRLCLESIPTLRRNLRPNKMI